MFSPDKNQGLMSNYLLYVGAFSGNTGTMPACPHTGQAGIFHHSKTPCIAMSNYLIHSVIAMETLNKYYLSKNHKVKYLVTLDCPRWNIRFF